MGQKEFQKDLEKLIAKIKGKTEWEGLADDLTKLLKDCKRRESNKPVKQK